MKTKEKLFFGVHNHTELSNLRLRDSINKVGNLIQHAHDLGHCGLAITDHECLSSHVQALQYVEKGKAQGKIRKDFKLALGNEIYLVDRNIVESAREKNERIKFYHLILIAKDAEGHRLLRELSSEAWLNSFHYKGLERTPTYKDHFIATIKENRGHLICSSACLGGELASKAVEYANTNSLKTRQEIIDFVTLMLELFGRDFYIELQPSHMQDQKIANDMLISIANTFGVKLIISTDTHYLKKEHRVFHKYYLNAADGDREVDDFYSSTYLMTEEELQEYFTFDISSMIYNTNMLSKRIEEYSLHQEIQIPTTKIELTKDWESIFSSFDEYEFIKLFINSPYEIDRKYMEQLEKGFIEKKQEFNEINLKRIDTELEILWTISKKLNQRMSSYYYLMQVIVDLIWDVSYVGIARGSATGFYTAYLLGITQQNPIIHNLPEWRHLDKNKQEIPDIDIDTESGQRENIIQIIKQHFGESNVINIGTFKTEAIISAIKTVCRGMEIPLTEAEEICSLVPRDKAVPYSLDRILEGEAHHIEGSKDQKDCECSRFLNKLREYPNLLDTLTLIEGLICGRSTHASGIYIYNDGIVAQNAIMKTPKGQVISQYSMSDSDWMGGLKYDLLTIEALDKIRKCMDILIEYKVIEPEDTLRKTYDKYLHPDTLEFNDPEMWKYLYEGEVLQAFQFETTQGAKALKLIKPMTLDETIAGNSLMRLTVPSGEQPIEKFARHKQNIELWYNEMRSFGLIEVEIKTLEKYLLSSYGVATTQEDAMELAMCPDIANFDLIEANKLRKAIAKAKAKDMLAMVKDLFYSKGLASGNRHEIIDYVWTIQITPMLGYSFSRNHVCPYSTIMVQEMNLCYKHTPLFWKTACLSVASGIINEDKTVGSDYAKIAKAIGDMPKKFVMPPDINKSGLEFTPNQSENKVLFGMAGIVGIGPDLVKDIISLRPYASFDDFYERVCKTKIVPFTKMINLIKAGCFNKFGDKYNIMIDFFNKSIYKEGGFNTNSLPNLIALGIIPEHLSFDINIYQFKSDTFKIKNLTESINKTHGYYKIDEKWVNFYRDHLKANLYAIDPNAIRYNSEGLETISSKAFNKMYEENKENLSTFLKSQELMDAYNTHLKRETWMKYCNTYPSAWEMESMCFYSDEHELKNIPIGNYFNISDFEQLPEQPTIAPAQNKNNKYAQKTLTLIAGTVVDKNKDKHILYLLTESGVVQVKYYKDAFLSYNNNNKDEKSWFTRGNKLVIVGYRDGDLFRCKTYKNSPYPSSTFLIAQYNHEKVFFKFTRTTNED